MGMSFAAVRVGLHDPTQTPLFCEDVPGGRGAGRAGASRAGSGLPARRGAASPGQSFQTPGQAAGAAEQTRYHKQRRQPRGRAGSPVRVPARAVPPCPAGGAAAEGIYSGPGGAEAAAAARAQREPSLPLSGPSAAQRWRVKLRGSAACPAPGPLRPGCGRGARGGPGTGGGFALCSARGFEHLAGPAGAPAASSTPGLARRGASGEGKRPGRLAGQAWGCLLSITCNLLL